MSLLRNVASGLRSLFRKEQVDRELDEELRAYQEMAADEKMKDGMTRAEARRAVRLERGSIEGAKETVRTEAWESFVETATYASPCALLPEHLASLRSRSSLLPPASA